jgi:hypothetical protein
MVVVVRGGGGGGAVGATAAGFGLPVVGAATAAADDVLAQLGGFAARAATIVRHAEALSPPATMRPAAAA